MKNFTGLLLIFISYAIISGPVKCATYYVNVIGSNSNSPSQAKNIATPWQTVQFAIDNDSVLNGDNIVIAPGTYTGFNLTKRLNIIGAWKGGMPAVNTIFNTTITLNASGGNSSERITLKNLRAASLNGNAIELRTSFVTLENVFATAPGPNSNGIIFNTTKTQDILIEACNINNNNRAGIYIPAISAVAGLIIRNTTFNTNGYFAIAAFQSDGIPNQISNVEISHCSFIDNNFTNQIQGHTIYFEKLKNATFKNISVVMPQGNNCIGININLLSRTDYSNINILNSRIIRSTPGSGIWIQARNDLSFPPAELDTVVLRGVTFTNCDTNITFNRNVKNMTVDKCDLSQYLAYGLVNFTDSAGVINAANNKWQNGAVPDTTILSWGTLFLGSPIITSMPNTDGIFIGMGIRGQGISPGAIVIAKTAVSIIMSLNAVASGTSAPISFAFNFATSTDIMRTTENIVQCGNPLQNSIVNESNVSFFDLASAITGTSPGGTIYNLPNTLISGTTSIDKDLTLIGPGAGFLHSGSLTTFQNLHVSSLFLMGSDFAVSENFTPGFTSISNDNTLMINGRIVAGGHLTGGARSDLFFGGTGSNTTLRNLVEGLRTLQISRRNGITFANDVIVRRLLFLQNGNLTLRENDLLMDRASSIFNPFPDSSYVNTNGSGRLRKFFDKNSITSFNYAVGSGGYSPVRVCIPDFIIGLRASLSVRVINTKHPENQCSTDYINRYWKIDEQGMPGLNADFLFGYNVADVVGNEANLYGSKWDGISWTTFTPVNTSSHTFSINGVRILGDYTAGGLDCINNFNTVINAKVFLEGAYLGLDSMRTNLLGLGLIPLSQPYDTTPFNYNGTETVTSAPADVVDWVYLELRATSGGPPIQNGRRAAFIKSDGSIVDLDGVSPVKTDITDGNYFIVIGHRNHLPVMSTNAQRLDSVSTLYDFSTGLNKFFGGDAASLGINQFGLYAGDATKSFIITAADYTVVTNNLFTSNYNQGDINMTGIVTAADYTLITKNIFKSSNVPNYP